MKTSLFFSLSFALLLGSCSKDADIIQPDVLKPAVSLSDAVGDGTIQNDAAVHTHYVKVNARHYLSGTATIQPIKVTATEGSQDLVSNSRYYILATGDAESTIYARGRTVLGLYYDLKTRRITGLLKTEFYYGEVMEVAIDDIANVRYDGKNMQMNIDIKESSFSVKGERVQFSGGELVLTLPADLKGAFRIDLLSELGN